MENEKHDRMQKAIPRDFNQLQRLVVTVLIVLLAVGVTWSCQEDEERVNLDAESSAKAGMAHESTKGSAGRTGSFHEDVGLPISDEVAAEWKRNYKKNSPNGVESHFFGKNAFEKLLSQKNAVGISIHYAINESGIPQLLLVAIDSEGKMILKSNASEGGRINSDEGLGFLDMSNICPPMCSN